MTDAIESSVKDDWGTWKLAGETSSRAADSEKTKYIFKSSVHKTDDGKDGTFGVETNPAGAAIYEDEDSDSKIEANGIGLDSAEKIYTTSKPVLVAINTMNLSEAEQNEVFTLEAVEKDSGKVGVKVSFKAPASFSDKSPNCLIAYYIDKAGNTSTRADYYFTNSETQSEGTFYFPFVDEDSFVSLNFLLQYYGDDSAPYQFSASYSVNTKSGLGTIGILPKNYNNNNPCTDSRIVEEDDKLTVNGIAASSIIPKSIKTVDGSARFEFFYTKSNEPVTCWNESSYYGDRYIPVDEFEDTYTLTDYPKPNKRGAAGFEYYFCQFMYKYSVEEYPECSYSTPSIMSAIREVPNVAN